MAVAQLPYRRENGVGYQSRISHTGARQWFTRLRLALVAFALLCQAWPASAQFPGIGGGGKSKPITHYEIIQEAVARSAAVDALPATTPAANPARWWQKRHERKVHQAASGRAEFVMIGDSLVHNFEKKGLRLWTLFYGRYQPLNLGFNRDATENAIWRIQNGELDGISARLIVIMIGTNNGGLRLDPPEHTAAGIKRLVEILQVRQPQAEILLLGIFPRGPLPAHPLRRLNAKVNSLLPKLATELHINYLDISDKFLDEKGLLHREIMHDFLHPTVKGYQIWAESIDPMVSQLLSQR